MMPTDGGPAGPLAGGRRLLSTLLDAFVDAVEPAIALVARDKRIVVVETADGDLAFHRVSARKATFLGKGETLGERDRRAMRARRKPDVELRLHPDRVIATTFRIPAEAAPFAAQIVESRLDRLTPWKPDKLLYGFAVAARPGADGQRDVDFVATSREIGASAIARLVAYDLVPSRMGPASGPVEQRLPIDLLKGANDTVRLSRRRAVAGGALAVMTVVVLAFLASVFAQGLAATQLAEKNDALTQLRRRLVEGSGTQADREREAALLKAKAPGQAQVVLIDRLATLIPETTFLDALDIAPGTVRMTGSSPEASALIPLIESEPGFSEATFSAPVIRQEDGLDRFDITVQRAAAEPEAAP